MEGREPRMTARGFGPRTNGWESGLRSALSRCPGSIDLMGVGNPIRGDDSVGLAIASELRQTLGANPARGYRIHKTTLAPERLLSKLALSSGRILIFDAVEASREPGAIVCATLGESKYGYFATHNIPLRLIPGLESRINDVFLVGVQPLSVEIGEGLSDVVRESAAQIVAAVTDAVGVRP
jgi:hydrogenase maturation protease